MSPSYRSRSKIRHMAVAPLWYRYYDPHIYPQGSIAIERTTCTDYYKKEVRDDGTLPPTDFELVRKTYRPIRVSGTRHDSGGELVLRFNARAYTMETPDPPGGWQGVEDNKSTNDFIRDLLSTTNPFRPTVSVPVMIKELAEVVTLFQIRAKTLAALPGSLYLNYKFGWEQFYRDLFQLAKISKEVERRILEFNSLVQQGGLRRKVKLGTFRKDHWLDSGAIGTDYYVGIYGTWQTHHTSKVWGSVRWRPKDSKPGSNPISPDPIIRANQALLAVLDQGSIDPHTVWNLVPFSWLVDYFTSVSDAMLAVQDSEKVEPYDICIMRHRTSHKNIRAYQYNPGPHDNFNVGNGGCSKITKLRTVRNSAPEYEDLLRFGWFTPNQAATILALLTSLRR